MLTGTFRVFWFGVALAGTLSLAASDAVMAQIPGLNPNTIQRALQNPQTLQRALQNQDLTAGQQNLQQSPSVQIYQPVLPEDRPQAPPSRLESLYSMRAGRMLTQFGYDILGVPTPVSATQVGAAQDSYVLGVGDEIFVVLRGQEEDTYQELVNRDGQIILPKLNPIQALGRTLGEFRTDLTRQVARTYISTNAFVSLGRVREISVLVTGEVRAPGTRILNAMATPLDALLISGGIAKTGSLRDVSIVRGNQTISIDLYALLTQGNFAGGGPLQNGDRIFVPPLQTTVAVSGFVRRPGIYELRPGESALDAAALIGLAGGFEIAGAYRLSKTQLERDGTIRLVSIAQNTPVASGEILFIDSNVDSALDRVRTAGAVRLPGAYPRATAPSVAGLIQSLQDVTPEAFTPFALVARRDARLNTRLLLPFSLTRVLSGADDVVLQNDDVVYLLTRAEMRALADAAAAVTAPGITAAPSGPQVTGASVDGIPFDNSQPLNGYPYPGAGLDTSGSTNTNLNSNTNANANTNTNTNASNAPNLAGALLGNPQGAPAPNANVGAAVLQALSGGAPNAAPGNANANTRVPPGQQGPNAAAANALQNGLLDAREPADILTSVPGLSRETRATVRRTAENLDVTPEVLVRVAGDHIIWVLDQVGDPGAYLAAGPATLDDVIQIAGGALDRADLSFVEVTSTNVDGAAGASRTVRTGYKGTIEDFRRVTVRPLDVVRLRPVFADRDQGQVRVTGEVRFPGDLDITRGEHLSALLERVGGLTDQAYPYGAIFLRRRAALAERENNIRQARELEAQIANIAIAPTSITVDPAINTTGVLGSLAQQLRTAPALGRITVTADPAVLRVKPELDILLEPGDRLFIPKRPSTVTVWGEVLNTGSFQYEGGLTVNNYVDHAGGTTEGADRGRIFVVLPDGSARSVTESWLSFSRTNLLPPGSTIIVPRDIRPFILGQFLRDTTAITSQIAITAASVAVLVK